MEEKEYTMAGNKLQSWCVPVFPMVEVRQKKIRDGYKTYRRVENILIRDGKLPAPRPNYEEEVGPLIEPTETNIVDRFPPMTVKEGTILKDVLSNERD